MIVKFLENFFDGSVVWDVTACTNVGSYYRSREVFFLNLLG
jgi:hypothetical protein